MGKEKEVPFQLFLARLISKAGHTVGLIDASTDEWALRFSTKGGIKPDLLVRLNPESELSWTFPVIAIETKTDGSNSISEAIDGIEKIIKLRQSVDKLAYSLGGVLCAKPTAHLLATPLSVSDGLLCRWRPKDITLGTFPPLHPDADTHLTDAVRLILGRYDCGLLLWNTFYAKIDGQFRKVRAPW